jgi:hypothetical protein
MAPNPIQSRLDPVRSRQRALSALDGLFHGIAVGAGLAVAIELARRSTGLWLTPWPSVLAVPVCALAGAIVFATREPSYKNAAAAVDARYNLKDRAVTALELAALPEPSPIQALALADAVAHLSTPPIDPRQVVPLTLPPGWWRPALAAGLALLLTALPLPHAHTPPPVSPEVSQSIQKEADKLIEELKKAEEVAATQNNPELKKLANDLKNLAQELKETTPAPREALAKLSEMQNAIRQEQAKFNTALAQEHLKTLGQALAANPTTSQAGKALQEGKNDQAAKALEEKTSLPENADDRQKLSQDLKDAANKMQESGLDDLAQATQKLSDAAKQGSSKDFSEGAKSLGKLTRQQDQRKKNDDWMNNQLARLNDAKQEALQKPSDSQNTDSKGSEGQQQAQGNQPGQGDQQAQGKASTEGEGNKSGEGQGNKPRQSNQWGTGDGGDPLGDPTKIDAKRQQEQLTGKLGQSGESETQTTHTSQGKDQAKATYKETHQRYQKLSESVLENEPLPLGQRQAIRKYFEAIRPTDAEP